MAASRAFTYEMGGRVRPRILLCLRVTPVPAHPTPMVSERCGATRLPRASCGQDGADCPNACNLQFLAPCMTSMYERRGICETVPEAATRGKGAER